MTMTTPDLAFRISDFEQEWLNNYGDGYKAAVAWLASAPAKDEVVRVARIHRDLRDGGVSGCDTMTYDATQFKGFLTFLEGTHHQREIFNGVKEMAEINARQGTNYPAWPERAFNISFDEDVLLGFAAACHAAAKMGAR